VYVEVPAVEIFIVSLPFDGFDPDHAPEALHDDELVEDHDKSTDEPTSVDIEVLVKDDITALISCGNGSLPPPPPPPHDVMINNVVNVYKNLDFNFILIIPYINMIKQPYKI
jgi:hypothetical protein